MSGGVGVPMPVRESPDGVRARAGAQVVTGYDNIRLLCKVEVQV